MMGGRSLGVSTGFEPNLKIAGPKNASSGSVHKKKAAQWRPFIGALIAPRFNERLTSCGQVFLPFIQNVHNLPVLTFKGVSGR